MNMSIIVDLCLRVKKHDFGIGCASNLGDGAIAQMVGHHIPGQHVVLWKVLAVLPVAAAYPFTPQDYKPPEGKRRDSLVELERNAAATLACSNT